MRPKRQTQLKKVDYAILHTGQQIPGSSSSSSEDSESDIAYRSSERKRLRETKKVKQNLPRKRKTIKTTQSESQVLEANAIPKSMDQNDFSGFSTLGSFIEYLKQANNIVVLAGAGMSVSCGIPDFRSQDGIYAIVAKMKLALPEPECLFHIDFFRDDPKPFYQLFKTVFTMAPTPSLTHRFLYLLQQKGKLLRVYSQNIDDLEEGAGVQTEKCINCHGSYAWCECMRCKKNIQTSAVYHQIQSGTVPKCNCGGVLKPTITFFGEKLSDKVNKSLMEDQKRADLLLIIGTSLKVSPVADIPRFFASAGIPQVVINKTALQRKRPINSKRSFDLSLLGNCDDVVQYLCSRCEWGFDDRKKVCTVHEHEDSTFCFEECHLTKSTQRTPPEENREAYVCDGCDEPIDASEMLYSCRVCFDYDLCSRCYPVKKAQHVDGTHEFQNSSKC